MKTYERQIVGDLVMELADAGFLVELESRDYLYVYASNNGDDGTHKHWIILVEGNGFDIISDYSVGVEKYIKKTLDLADRLASLEE